MALKLIGTPSSATYHTLDASTSPWATWSNPTVAWVSKADGGLGVALQSGTYRVEPIGGQVRWWPDDGSEAADITATTVLKAGLLRAYSTKTPATHLIITRLT